MIHVLIVSALALAVPAQAQDQPKAPQDRVEQQRQDIGGMVTHDLVYRPVRPRKRSKLQ